MFGTAAGHSVDKLRRGYVQRNLEMGNDAEAARVRPSVQDQPALAAVMLLTSRQRLCRILHDIAEFEADQAAHQAAAQARQGPPARRRPPTAEQKQELQLLARLAKNPELKAWIIAAGPTAYGHGCELAAVDKLLADTLACADSASEPGSEPVLLSLPFHCLSLSLPFHCPPCHYLSTAFPCHYLSTALLVTTFPLTLLVTTFPLPSLSLPFH